MSPKFVIDVTFEFDDCKPATKVLKYRYSLDLETVQHAINVAVDLAYADIDSLRLKPDRMFYTARHNRYDKLHSD